MNHLCRGVEIRTNIIFYFLYNIYVCVCVRERESECVPVPVQVSADFFFNYRLVSVKYFLNIFSKYILKVFFLY